MYQDNYTGFRQTHLPNTDKLTSGLTGKPLQVGSPSLPFLHTLKHTDEGRSPLQLLPQVFGLNSGSQCSREWHLSVINHRTWWLVLTRAPSTPSLSSPPPSLPVLVCKLERAKFPIIIHWVTVLERGWKGERQIQTDRQTLITNISNRRNQTP